MKISYLNVILWLCVIVIIAYCIFNNKYDIIPLCIVIIIQDLSGCRLLHRREKLYDYINNAENNIKYLSDYNNDLFLENNRLKKLLDDNNIEWDKD